jgi:hypothetical protein
LSGAHDQDRTDDLILTKDVLYQLSYMGTLNTDFILMRKATKNHLPLAFLSEKPEGLVRCLSFLRA